LKSINSGDKVPMGNNVVVVGGGNVAVDTAMSALRLGAAKVHLVSLESSEEMPAHRAELADALEEGVILNNCWGIKRITGNGRVTGIDLVGCTCVFDQDKRFNPQFDESVRTSIDADTVILAIGTTVDSDCLRGEDGIKLTAQGTIKTNPYSMETDMPGVFAGGDSVKGLSNVAEAAAGGKAAADAIDSYLQGDVPMLHKSYGNFVKMERKEAFDDPVNLILEKNSLRQVPPKLSPSERKSNFAEIFGGYSEEQAILEAKRCLKYDLELEETSKKRMTQMGKATFVLDQEA
jgi:NADPH-dependent glutamate synthase beta subunit-like oxidoreductase